jgi:predicted permease
VQHVLTLTFPFFALVALGFSAARLALLPLAAVPGLNAFVLFFALPCMLFRFGASTPIAQLFDVQVALVYVTCASLVVALAIGVTRRGRIGWNDAAFGALVGAFPNTGFMGVPLVVALKGAQAAGPAILVVFVDMVFTSSLCIALSRLGTQGVSGPGATVGQALGRALRGVLTNPLPWSILFGASASAFELGLPKPLTQTVGLLADAASPVALFTIGAVLARSQMAARDEGSAALRWQEYLPVVAIKLFVHPLLVCGVGAGAMWMGFAPDPFSLAVLVLLAALPSASNVSMLAERYGADNGRIARIILVSTAAAFFTFSGAVALVAGAQ